MRLGLSVWPDQALNLIRACTMLDVSFYAVDSVHAGEHIGRIGRSGCCHGCCRDKRPGLGRRGCRRVSPLRSRADGAGATDLVAGRAEGGVRRLDWPLPGCSLGGGSDVLDGG